MVKLVSTLGTTPGGIFETFMNLRQGKYEGEDVKPIDIKEVYVIRTSDKGVEFAWKLVKAIFTCCKGGEVTISDIPLPMQDITSPEDFKKFRREVFSRVSVGDYVDFTGGRKAMSVAAALVAREVKAHVVTTIIPQEEYNRVLGVINVLKNMGDLVEKAGKGNCDPIKDYICKLVSNEARTVVLL